MVAELKSKKFGFYSDARNKYAMGFDTSAVQGKGVVHLYNTLSEQQSKTCNYMVEGFRLMIKRQCAMFPKGQDFDFRCLFSGHNVDEAIYKYFDCELMDTLNKITISDSEVALENMIICIVIGRS